jgi:hypothetical protein
VALEPQQSSSERQLGQKELDMPLRALARSQWQSYVDRVSAALGAQRVEIEATGLGLDSPEPTDWIALTGIRFDPENDLLAIKLDGFEHTVRDPTRVCIDHDFDWLHSIEVFDAEGNHHILLLKAPLPLTSP